MVPTSLLWAGFEAFVAATALTPIMRGLFRAWNVMDLPGRRKVHAYPIPRVGGPAIAIACTIALLGLLDTAHPLPGYADAFQVLPGAVLIFLTGLADDFLTLKPAVKLLGEIAAAVAVVANGLRIDNLAGLALPLWVALPLTLFWLLLATNAFNLIDGLDGLCAGLGLIGAAAFFAVGVIGGDSALMFTTLPLAGALSGFLVFNFNPATVFLGDSGALTIGFALGCSAILWMAHSDNFASALVPLLALSVPLLDVSVSVVRRTLKLQPIFSADREHIHHRVLDRTASPRRTVLTLYLLAAPGAIAGVLLITPLVPRHFHLLALPAFCLAIGVGIRWLRYPEFQVAGHWLWRGGFRRTLAAQARVEQLGADLERAASADEWWQTLVDAGREAGWFRLTWTRDGSRRHEVLAERAPEWSFTVALGAGESLLVEGGAPAARPSLDLVAFSTVARRKTAS